MAISFISYGFSKRTFHHQFTPLMFFSLMFTHRTILVKWHFCCFSVLNFNDLISQSCRLEFLKKICGHSENFAADYHFRFQLILNCFSLPTLLFFFIRFSLFLSLDQKGKDGKLIEFFFWIFGSISGVSETTPPLPSRPLPLVHSLYIHSLHLNEGHFKADSGCVLMIWLCLDQLFFCLFLTFSNQMPNQKPNLSTLWYFKNGFYNLLGLSFLLVCYWFASVQ